MNLLNLDIHTLIVLLFAGNLVLALVMLTYPVQIRDRYPYTVFLIAKVFQSIAWLMLSLRGQIPDFYSVYIANTILLTGFGLEGIGITSIRARRKGLHRVFMAVTALGVALFWAVPNQSSIRIVTASLASMAIFITASVAILPNSRHSLLMKVIGIFYFLFGLILFSRAFVAFSAGEAFTLMTGNLIQSLSFLPLHLFMLGGSIGFLLVLKEENDKSLAASEMKFSSAFQLSPSAMLLTRLDDGKIVEFNRAFEQMSQFSGEEITGNSILSLNFWVIPQTRMEVTDEIHHQGKVINREMRFRKKSGEEFTGLFSSSMLKIAGREYILSTILDISERIKAEENVQSMLREKEIILKEVHHRIKNNMNSVVSLLRLQAGTQSDSRSARALTEAAARVQSMTVLYDRLYRSRNTAEMSLDQYAGPLLQEVVNLFPVSARIEVVLKVGDIMIPAQILSTIGMIINELATNSLKYAFGGKETGRIAFSAELKDDWLEMTYEDDGAGLADASVYGQSGGFGAELVRMLVRQLEGSLEVETAPNRGLKARIRIPFLTKPPL